MELKVGDKVPNFLSIDTNGAPFDSQNCIGKKPVVLYFYPKDNTPVVQLKPVVSGINMKILSI